jgi:hypothetical protein
MKRQIVALFDGPQLKKLLLELDLDWLSILSLILAVGSLALFGWVVTNLDIISASQLILGSILSLISAMLAAVVYFAKLRRNTP